MLAISRILHYYSEGHSFQDNQHEPPLLAGFILLEITCHPKRNKKM